MRRVFRFIRYSSIGVFFAGIVTVLAGCSEREGALFAALLLLLNFCSGPVAEETIAPPSIVMFSAGEYNGDLATAGAGADGREGADNLCQANKPASITAANVRAFISVGAADEIRDMPGNYGVPITLPITGPTGITISSDWPNLLDGGIDVTLENAGVATNAFWLSGSTPEGAIQPKTCNAWMTDTGVTRVGRTTETSSAWISAGDAACGPLRDLLCLAY